MYDCFKGFILFVLLVFVAVGCSVGRQAVSQTQTADTLYIERSRQSDENIREVVKDTVFFFQKGDTIISKTTKTYHYYHRNDLSETDKERATSRAETLVVSEKKTPLADKIKEYTTLLFIAGVLAFVFILIKKI